jgi:hypothetical protein
MFGNQFKNTKCGIKKQSNRRVGFLVSVRTVKGDGLWDPPINSQ